MSQSGAYVARCWSFSAPWGFVMVVFSVLMVLSSSLPSRLRLDRDLPGLRVRRLRQRDRQHAVLQRRRALLGVHLARQAEAPAETHGRALLAVHVVALRRVRLALAAQ